MNRFLELQMKVQKELLNELKANKIGVTDLMGALYLLGQTKSEQELLTCMEMFKEDYAVLGRILKEESDHEQESELNLLNSVVIQLIKDNPKNAARASKISTDADFSREKLLNEFPEALKYFSQ